jgi:pimeloyl-ACP methyl ester carboxylesterase
MSSIGRFRMLQAYPPAGSVKRGTLLLIHAFPLSAEMWRGQLELSSSGWHVVAPHLRGFGGGSDESPVRAMDDYAADLLQLLDELRVEHAVVGGLSLGGYIAFALLRRAATRFRGLILADTRSEADTPEGIENRRKMLSLLEEKGPPGVADQMIPKLLAPATISGQPDVVAAVRGMIVSNAPAGIAGAISAMMTRPDSTPLLSAIRCPTLVIVGEHDALTPPALAERLQHGIPQAERIVIADAGHLPNLEGPARFNSAVAAFLGRI